MINGVVQEQDMLYLAAILASLFAASSGQSLTCPWVTTLDCHRYLVSYLCGTDYVTYENQCDFAKEACKNHDLHILAKGTCVSNHLYPPTTTVPIVGVTSQRPGPTTTRAPIFLGHNVVLDFFCLELSHEKCPENTEMVCGDNNVSYNNFCEFEKARCTHRALQAKHYGACV